MLYKDWLWKWLELYIRPSTKERTYQKYRRQAEKYILPALGACEIDALSAVRLQEFSASLSGRGLAANTVNGILFVLRASLKKSVALGIAHRQYTDAIVRPRAREKQVLCFDLGEQKKIEQYVREHNTPYLFGIVLSLYTGLRIGELLALTWEDIDFGRGTVRISRSCFDGWENGRYKKMFDTTKTRSSERIIPLPQKLLSPLKELKNSSKSVFVVTGKTPSGAQVRSYQRTFERLLKRLNIPHKGFHALRHTFATRALEVGMDVKTLSEILGHRDPTVTLRRYAHSLMEHKAEMMNRLNMLLS